MFLFVFHIYLIAKTCLKKKKEQLTWHSSNHAFWCALCQPTFLEDGHPCYVCTCRPPGVCHASLPLIEFLETLESACRIEPISRKYAYLQYCLVSKSSMTFRNFNHCKGTFACNAIMHTFLFCVDVISFAGRKTHKTLDIQTPPEKVFGPQKHILNTYSGGI